MAIKRIDYQDKTYCLSFHPHSVVVTQGGRIMRASDLQPYVPGSTRYTCGPWHVVEREGEWTEDEIRMVMEHNQTVRKKA